MKMVCVKNVRLAVDIAKTPLNARYVNHHITWIHLLTLARIA